MADEIGGNEAEAMWERAERFPDLCELTVQFIEGAVPFHPGHGDAIDPETTHLVPFLAEFNRRGFLTECSQPGEPLDDQGGGQRAFVTGYAMEKVAKRIARLTLFTDLYVSVSPPDVECGYQLPVTLSGFHPCTWVGVLGYEDRQSFEHCCGAKAIAELRRAWSVCVIDLSWGRDEYLWTHVRDELTGHFARKPYSVKPDPDLGLDRDFVY